MPKKVLLVDNNREYRHALASIVRRVGYDVIHAEEIADAVERLVSDRPDLVMIGDGVEINGLKIWLIRISHLDVSTPER